MNQKYFVRVNQCGMILHSSSFNQSHARLFWQINLNSQYMKRVSKDNFGFISCFQDFLYLKSPQLYWTYNRSVFESMKIQKMKTPEVVLISIRYLHKSPNLIQSKPNLTLTLTKVIHPKYYKHLRKSAHQSHLGRKKMRWFLAD